MECKICKKNKELRMGTCFSCADAESIISEGVDMWGKGLDSDGGETHKGEQGIVAKTPMQKLQLLMQKGWKK